MRRNEIGDVSIPKRVHRPFSRKRMWIRTRVRLQVSIPKRVHRPFSLSRIRKVSCRAEAFQSPNGFIGLSAFANRLFTCIAEMFQSPNGFIGLSAPLPPPSSLSPPCHVSIPKRVHRPFSRVLPRLPFEPAPSFNPQTGSSAFQPPIYCPACAP